MAFKVSAGEKARMLRMYGLPDAAGDKCFPRWFKDLFGKHMDEVTEAISIATAVERNFVIDDAEVPLYPALEKFIELGQLLDYQTFWILDKGRESTRGSHSHSTRSCF